MNNPEFGAKDGGERIKLSEFGKSAFVNAVCFALAALTASASQTDFFSPLGVAFCSGTGRGQTLFSCFGAMLGYIIANDYYTAFRYVMALIIVYILKAYINSFERLKEKTVLSAVISLFSVAATGIIVTVTQPFDSKALFLRIAEFITAFAGAYIFASAFHSASRLKKGEGLTPRETLFLIISALMIILSARRLEFFGVSPAGIVCSYAVMCAAYVFRESGGAVIGTGASLGLAMTGANSPHVFCYSAAGLFSGIFSYSGRVLCAMAYIFSYGSMFLFFGASGEDMASLIETAVGSVAFILTPQKYFYMLKVKAAPGSGEGAAVQSLLTSRIRMIKNAVGDMSETVSKVSSILKEKAAPDTAGVYLRVRDGVCGDCASFRECWGKNFAQTAGEFDCMLEEIRKTGGVTPSSSPASLQSRCIRIMSLCDSFNKNYSSYSARRAAEGRINEMRKITADQFQTVCDMLDDLLEDFSFGVRPLAARCEALTNSIRDIGAHAQVNCYEDEDKNFFVSVSLKKDCPVTAGDIKQAIESVTEKEFEEPVTVDSANETMLLFWERAGYSAECVYYQVPSEEGEICGDCFDSFFDGRGNFVAVLSDGMGTGSRAAIDGAMASSLLSKLIVAGFSFPCAMRLVNSAMLIKSHEESLATLDILKINLYTGQAVIYKAGAALSLLRRQNKVSEIKKPAMPIGILRQAQFATVRGVLKDGDVIVMMSDGVGDSAVNQAEAFVAENPFSYDLPQKLCLLAKSKTLGRSDDITVAAIKIKRNEKTGNSAADL